MPLPTEAFLSHSDQNRAFATRLAEVLADHGVPVWYSRRNIRGAEQWHDEIGAALDRCDWFLLVLSPDAVKSKWVKRELVYALQEARYENRIVPLSYRPCNHKPLSWTLSSYQQVDFSHDFHAGCRELLRIWGVGYRARS
ncbi:MAG: toll/interleukin-1 receptor domain-containing protein [Candidatus Binatia bacterium]